MSSITSAMTRSAPRPLRSSAIACSMSAACVTLAPRSIAIFVAAPIWPCRLPTMRSRMIRILSCSVQSLRLTGLDDFRHRDAEAILDQNHFAARDEAIVYVDVDRFADFAVELDDGSPAQL